MIKLKKINKFLGWWPFLLLAFLTIVFFWKFFLKGLIPFPADITVGLYYPWLDYKWGFPVGVPVKNPLPSDIPSLLYPWRIFVIDQLKKGIFPLWNPFYFGGMPLLANFQSAVFSWVNLFFLFLPEVTAWSMGVVIQPFLTAFFTFLFLRHLKIGKAASVLGGIVFAFGGFNLMWLEYNVHGHTGMWLPILLFSVDKIIQERKWLWTVLGGILLSVQIFAGYPQIVVYCLTAVGSYALFRLFYQGKKEKNLRFLLKTVLALAFLVALGGSLAAVQILPGLEALKLSVREIDPIAQLSSGGYLPWQNLITLLFPDFFGNPATYNFWGKPWYDNFALYVGILPLLLAFMAIFLRRDKLSWFFSFLAFFAFALALPTPMAEVVNLSGIYGINSISARIIFLLDFSLAILAALGLDWLEVYNDRLKERSRWWGVWGILAIFLISFFALWGFVLTANRFFPEADWLVNLSIAKRNLILPTALFLASALILMTSFFLKKLTKRLGINCLPLAIIVIILLTTLDLFRFGWKYLPFSKPELVFPETPVIEHLKEQPKPFRVEFGEAIPQNMWLPYGLESAAGSDALASLRYSQFLGALRTGQASTPYGRVGQVENYDSPLFDLANIKYVLAVKYDEKGVRSPQGKPRPIFENSRFKLVFEDKTVRIYENLKVLPRAFWVHNFEAIREEQKIIDKLLSPDFNLKEKIVLEENLGFEPPQRVSREEKIEWLEYQPGKIVLRVFSDQPGFIFLSNSYYPGWRASVDSQPAKIYRADFAFSAINLLQGEHLVEFIYDPLSFKIGLYFSFGTLILVVIGGVGIYRFRKEWW